MSLLLKEKFLTEDIDMPSYSFYCAGTHHWLCNSTTKGSLKKNKNSNITMPGPHCQASHLIGPQVLLLLKSSPKVF